MTKKSQSKKLHETLGRRSRLNPFPTDAATQIDGGLEAFPVSLVILHGCSNWTGTPIWVRAARDRGILNISIDRVEVVIPGTGGERTVGSEADWLVRDDKNMVRVVSGEDFQEFSGK